MNIRKLKFISIFILLLITGSVLFQLWMVSRSTQPNKQKKIVNNTENRQKYFKSANPFVDFLLSKDDHQRAIAEAAIQEKIEREAEIKEVEKFIELQEAKKLQKPPDTNIFGKKLGTILNQKAKEALQLNRNAPAEDLDSMAEIPYEPEVQEEIVDKLQIINEKRIYLSTWLEIGTKQGKLAKEMQRVAGKTTKRILTFDTMNGLNYTIAMDILLSRLANRVNFNVDQNITQKVMEQTPSTYAVILIKEGYSFDEYLEFVQFISFYFKPTSLLVTKKSEFELIPVEYQERFEKMNWSVSGDVDYFILQFNSLQQDDVSNVPQILLENHNFDQNLIALRDPVVFDATKHWIIFLRIQKCSTKTLASLLNAFSAGKCNRAFLVTPPRESLDIREDCYSYSKCQDFASRLKVGNQRCRLFTEQHCDWQDISSVWNLEDGSNIIITWLRDPIQRVLSEWRFVEGEKTWDYCLSGMKDRNYTRDEFVRYMNSSFHKAGSENRQTRMLAGCGSKYSCQEIYGSDEQMLLAAKYHLLQSHIVGTTELFSESLVLLTHLLSFYLPEYTVIHDPPSPREDWPLDDELVNLIIQKNRLDIELYNFAQELVKYRVSLYKQRMNVRKLPKYLCLNDVCTLV